MNKQDNIIIRGARENNLKDVSLKIPKHQITEFIGTRHHRCKVETRTE